MEVIGSAAGLLGGGTQRGGGEDGSHLSPDSLLGRFPGTYTCHFGFSSQRGGEGTLVSPVPTEESGHRNAE